MIRDAKVLHGARFRVYDPPLPLELHPLAGGPLRDATDIHTSGHSFMDFDAQKVELGPAGNIILSHVEIGEEQTDLQSGRKYNPIETKVLAIIDPDGHLRAETVYVDLPLVTPPPRLD